MNSVELTRAVKKNIRFFNNLFPKIYTIISAAKIITTAARNSIQNINLWRKKPPRYDVCVKTVNTRVGEYGFVIQILGDVLWKNTYRKSNFARA